MGEPVYLAESTDLRLRPASSTEEVYDAGEPTPRRPEREASDAGGPPPLDELSAALGGVTISDLSEVPEGALVLVRGPTALELRPGPNARGARIEFPTAYLRSPRRHLSNRQPLARALGEVRRDSDPKARVLDATAGWGQDAFLMACLGHRVIAMERQPLLSLLLEDALRRARFDELLAPALERLTFLAGDTADHLRSTPDLPDTVYLDPMFPPKRKTSALPRKEVRLLKRLVGPDEDASALAELVLEKGVRRLVVKRPSYADPLVDRPTVTYEGKLVRYDVYRR